MEGLHACCSPNKHMLLLLRQRIKDFFAVFFFFNYLKEFCKFLLICCERAQSSPNHLFIFLPCPLLPTILRIAPSGSAVAEREGNMPQCGGWINPSFLTPRLESRGNQRM